MPEKDPSKQNSRVFTFRLSKNSNDPAHLNARNIMDNVWEKPAKEKMDFMVKSINLGAEEEYVHPTQYMRDLVELSKGLNEQIANLKAERQAMHSLLVSLKEADIAMFSDVATQFADDSKDVHPDLANSLFSLLED